MRPAMALRCTRSAHVVCDRLSLTHPIVLHPGERVGRSTSRHTRDTNDGCSIPAHLSTGGRDTQWHRERGVRWDEEGEKGCSRKQWKRY